MRIQNLVDNIQGSALCEAEHGLSYYVETKKHKILLDTGASDLFAKNAIKTGVDLENVDIVILSHGHFDHGGGLATFFTLNDQAKVYMQATAFGDYYALHDDGPEFIGLDPKLKESGRIVFVKGDQRIDEELSLFADITYYDPVACSPESPKVKVGEELVQDEYGHEQCLIITQGEKKYLFSGCAHHGILNIMRSYRDHFGSDPDYVFSGFHLRKRSGQYTEEDIREIKRIAASLKQYKTRFYTGHCTGEEPYRVMKEILGDKLEYMHCGDELWKE